MNDVVSKAVDLVSNLYPQAPGMGLYNEILSILRGHPEHGPLAAAYEADPEGNAEAAKRALHADPAAAGRLGPLVSASISVSTGGSGEYQIGDRFTIGDISQDGSGTQHIEVGNTRTKKIVFGGALLAIAAIVVLLLWLAGTFKSTPTPIPTDSATATDTSIVLPTATDTETVVTTPPTTTDPTTQTTSVSPTLTSTVPSPPAAAFSAGYGGITGSSTCADYLQSPQDVQYGSAERIAIAENNGQAAGDPFIVQNTEYSCGENLNTQLAYIMETIG